MREGRCHPKKSGAAGAVRFDPSGARVLTPFRYNKPSSSSATIVSKNRLSCAVRVRVRLQPPAGEAQPRARQSEEALLEARRELDRQLRPYRGKMTADQLAMLEKQYLDRNLLEKAGLPRLSLFYMR